MTEDQECFGPAGEEKLEIAGDIIKCASKQHLCKIDNYEQIKGLGNF